MKQKRYLPSATRRALADRAIRLANLLERWARELQDSAKEQNIDLWDEGGSDQPITLKRSEVRLLVDVMLQRVRAIRTLARD